MAIFVWWIALHVCYTVASGIVVGPRHTAKPGRVEWAVILLWYAIPLTWFVGRPMPTVEGFLAGLILYGLGGALVTSARKINPYFQPKIVKPPVVIRDGVYWLKHPGYIGMVMMGFGTIAILGNLAGAIPLSIYAAILAVRAWEEHWLIQSIDRTAVAVSSFQKPDLGGDSKVVRSRRVKGARLF